MKEPVPAIPDAPPPMALRYRLLSGGFAAAGRIAPRFLLPKLDSASLVDAAGVRPGPGARLGLDRLTESLAAETELNLFGQVTVRYDLVRLLRNAALIERMHAETPAIGARGVERPLFILGLPRSGTTFLHTLMSHDPDMLVPRNWQTIYPAPRPQGFDPARDASARRTDKQLALFAGLAPEFPLVHPIHADSPQECSEITAHVFQSLRFDSTFRVPSYLGWLDAHGHDEAFAFHKRFLQAMQHGVSARGWALKCPDHTFTMDAILRVYPDAQFVIVHRDPLHVFASVAHLTEVLRRPFMKSVDPQEIGAQVTARWIEGAQQLIAFDRRRDVAEANKIQIHYDDLVGNPLAAIRRIYEQFGYRLSPAGEAAMAAFMAAKPRGGYGRNRYVMGRFGINPERLRPDFAAYIEHFGVKARPA
ncbi:MAG TPA: sulfotransferase [Acetobacteraceae bacterium]|nr:sulfotransferase [Acetobacteraceae bacterium]